MIYIIRISRKNLSIFINSKLFFIRLCSLIIKFIILREIILRRMIIHCIISFRLIKFKILLFILFLIRIFILKICLNLIRKIFWLPFLWTPRFYSFRFIKIIISIVIFTQFKRILISIINSIINWSWKLLILCFSTNNKMIFTFFNRFFFQLIFITTKILLEFFIMIKKINRDRLTKHSISLDLRKFFIFIKYLTNFWINWFR